MVYVPAARTPCKRAEATCTASSPEARSTHAHRTQSHCPARSARPRASRKRPGQRSPFIPDVRLRCLVRAELPAERLARTSAFRARARPRAGLSSARPARTPLFRLHREPAARPRALRLVACRPREPSARALCWHRASSPLPRALQLSAFCVFVCAHSVGVAAAWRGNFRCTSASTRTTDALPWGRQTAFASSTRAHSMSRCV